MAKVNCGFQVLACHTTSSAKLLLKSKENAMLFTSLALAFSLAKMQSVSDTDLYLVDYLPKPILFICVCVPVDTTKCQQDVLKGYILQAQHFGRMIQAQ